MTLIENERPKLTFDMFQAGTRDGVRLAHRAFRDFFGHDNYDNFRAAAKLGKEVSEEDRISVDREIYAKVARLVGIQGRSGFGLWNQVLTLSNGTVNYARDILFTDQDRQATIITDIDRDWDEGRPSQILEQLTTSTSSVSEELKFERGRQLGLALLCAEVISHDQGGDAKGVLGQVQKAMYGPVIMGRIGDPTFQHVFSYHEPATNKLIGVTKRYPDSHFHKEGLWIKKIDLPVRKIAVIDDDGELERTVPAVYDPREKDVSSAVIKGMRRSLMVSQFTYSNIEAAPYMTDMLGFRLVLLNGGQPLRDRVAANMERFFGNLDIAQNIRTVDRVNRENGHPERVSFRRMQVSLKGLKGPLEVIVQSLEDYITYSYEIGEYDSVLGMHTGPAHDLYKLNRVASVAEYLWPPKLYGIDLKSAKTSASYEYATRLARKHRIYPSPYPDLAA